MAGTFTVFVLRPTRKAVVLTEIIGTEYDGSINCDRAKMYYQHKTLQWCWAHLKRDFQKLIDSNDNTVKRLGYDLMRETKKLFREYARCRDGTIRHATMRRNLQPVRRQVENYLLRGFGTAAHGMCKELYNHKEHLWTFLKDPEVEPTNNVSERSLRHGVIWRKLSFGTQSERGDRFVETMLTTIESCRQQGKSILNFVTQALRQDADLPTLVPCDSGTVTYSYTFPTTQRIAEIEGHASFNIKVGMASNHPISRIREQVSASKTAMSEAAVVLMVFQTDNCSNLESWMHSHLTRTPGALGREWFVTNPNQLLSLFRTYVASHEPIVSDLDALVDF